MAKYISNHPFVFIISLMVVISCCMGGFLAIPQSDGKLAEGTVTMVPPAVEPVTETASRTGLELPELVVTDTAIPEIATSRPTEEETTTDVPPTLTSLPATATATVSMVPVAATGQLVVHFIDVGQGDAILVISPEGLTMLIDGGSSGSGVMAYLRGRGVERIDLMVATHPHEDHIGGLIQVLETMPVGRVVTNGQAHTTSTYEHFLDAILASGADYAEVLRGDSLTLGGLDFSVLSPVGTSGDDLNENSIVLRMVYGRTALLFMGDAGEQAEASMLAAGLPLEANILKVGHHGSCTGTSVPFLVAVSPEVGIYSAGIGNQYGHPCAATISRLQQRGVQVFGTDVNGTIIVTVSTEGYRITNAAGEELRR